MNYAPYIRGVGPTKQQAEDNTLALAEKLIGLGIVFEFDREYASLWDGDDLALKIIKNYGFANEEILYINYDRWGFAGGGVENEIDQYDLEPTIEAIRNWLMI